MTEIKSANSNEQPGIIRYLQHHRAGIQSVRITRHGIGYVVRGKKCIYYGDICHEVNQGDIFYLSIGVHYIEDFPEGAGKPYEQIMFFYSPDSLSNILSALNIGYHMNITGSHSCDNCRDRNYVICESWSIMKGFFSTVSHYIREGFFSGNPGAEKLKGTELIYIVMSNPDCCIKSKILDSADVTGENFESTIQKNIFSKISIEDLAGLCNKSLTSFKKEFRAHFHESPHRWLIKQRLMHSRLLLISTNKSVSEIGNECNFPNTSHYIKLFKKEYGITPAAYRTKSKDRETVSVLG